MVFNVREPTKPSSRRTISRGCAKKSKFEKQREIEVVRNAQERGYLKSPTLESIWDSIGQKCDIDEIRYLNMNRIHLHKVKSIDLCTRLKICVLHSNYITNFEALGNCPELLLLDLHGNQIVSIPGPRFWEVLSHLQVMYLHDNGLSRLEYIHRIAASPSLSVLTLYNTPLSLKPNYRHHVVNSLWSLKAFDNYVVSDEEVIEDAIFGGIYSSMNESFYLPLYVSLSKENTFEEAVKKVYHVIGLVNSIQAKSCPVLVIQKWIRGFLARLRFKFIQDMRIWAAVSIQRFYRHYKGLEESTVPPPSSPTPNRSWHVLDYDAYLRGLKPGSYVSPVSSSERLRRGQSSRSVSIVIEPATQILEEQEEVEERVITSPVVDQHTTSISSPLPLRISTRVAINLQSLETSTYDIIRSKEPLLVDRGMGLKSRETTGKSWGVSARQQARSRRSTDSKIKTKELIREEERLKERERRGKKKPDKVGRYSTVKVFLGPIMKTHPVTDKDLKEEDAEAEIDTVQFRLAGLKPPVQKMDPVQEVLISKREAAIDVREAAREHERKMLNEPKRTVTRHSTSTTDQRLFIRTHGTMGMACLRAVQQAYRDREQAESHSAKTGLVARLRESREQAKERVRIFKQEYQEDSIRRRIRDDVRTAEALAEHDNKRVQAHQQYTDIRTATAERQKSRQADFAFANDFACQQSSVSNALLKHDLLAQKEEALLELIEAVRKEKENSQEQQVLVRRYLEHRQLMRQAETAMARATLDAVMLQEANQRVIEAKTRVARQRARNEQVRELSPLSISRAPPQLPPLSVVAQDQMEDWEKLPRFEWRPRSHERSMSEPTPRYSVFNTSCYSPAQKCYGLVEKAS